MRGQAVRGINYFKRHAADCPVKQMGLGKERERYFFDCGCAVWVYGKLPDGRQLQRASTHKSNLADAREIVMALIRQHEVGVAEKEATGRTVKECIATFLRDQADLVKDKTLGQHKLVLAKLQTFLDANAVTQMKGITVDLIQSFQTDGLSKYSVNTKSTMMAKVKSFLSEAERRDWLTTPIVHKLKIVNAVYEEKEPFSEKELKLILDETLKMDGGTHGYAKHPKTFVLLLRLMLETGMRVGDAVNYDPKRVRMGRKLFVYTTVAQKSQKKRQPKPYDVFLSADLKEAIDACEWLSPSHPFKWGDFANPNYLANEVYYRMQAIGERCGVTDCRPHRLRDTFAIRKLLQGYTLSDVQRLLGHGSIRITEKHYSAWVRERVDRLEDLLAAS